MGFNFGAFAAGMVEGAGDIMEKQHKETKDTIDKNMTFAYQQGLPYHRERMKNKRKLEGYASDLSSMQLTPDEISAVMGKSVSYIENFIASSQKEVQRTGGKFEVGSQINMKEGGRITPWQEVQFGTVDKSSVTPMKAPSRKSIFGSMIGADDTATSSGFSRLKNKAQSEMESITGASYDDVTAAGGGYYKYGQGSEASITMVDSSAARSNEYSELQLKNYKLTAPIQYDNLVWQSERSRTLAGREDAHDKLVVMQDNFAKIVLQDRIDSNIDSLELEGRLETLVYNTRVRNYSDDPYKGLYINTLGLLDEQLKPDSDPEKIKMYQDNQDTMRLLITEQQQIRQEGSIALGFNTYETTFDGKVQRELARSVSDDGLWIMNLKDGTRTFDWSKTKGKLIGDKVRAKIASEMIEDFRKYAASGTPTSPSAIQWMATNSNFDPDLVTLPEAPSLSNNDQVDPTKMYVYSNAAQIPKSTKGKDGVRVETVTDSGKITGYRVYPAGWDKNRDMVPATQPKPTHRLYYTVSGKKLLEMRAKQADDKKTADANAVVAQGVKVDKQYGDFRNMELSSSDLTEDPVTEEAVIKAEPTSMWDAAMGTGTPDTTIADWFAKQGKDIKNQKEATAMNRQLASNNNADATVEEFQAMTTLFGQVRYGSLPPEELRAALEKIATGGFNHRQITYAQGELAKLDAQ